ncbi:ROK family protein [Prosthecobacter dejongeii]|uniref:ROK family protein n=1 Tax=Prosthecobacter dejongeii TaxID=48465 RepID=A0A7W7YI58_9BACT|nr:ROK family protein [Prosthecobacter dejongeii]MBB5036569.1 hypothetical protein [Prosthecobacter dejongeii]
MIRVRPSGIFPLELWDLCLGTGILWDHMSQADFGGVLKHSLTQVWEGQGATRSEGLVPECVRGFQGLYLAGGGAESVLASLQEGPWSRTHLCTASHFAGDAGGHFLLGQQGLTGWVLDLGQSALKISAAGYQQTWPRDLTRLPLREDRLDTSVADQRAELRHFIAKALQSFLHLMGRRPDGLVCALPSRLDDLGIPEGSSYIGMGGDASLLPEALVLAGFGQTQLLVLNDAELAATSALLDPLVQRRTLVLTLGFGVGAALIT